MKKRILILATVLTIPMFARAAASAGTAPGAAPGTAFRPAAPSTPQPPRNPQAPASPNLGTVSRGSTNAFTPAGRTNFFGTNQFGTNGLSANLSPLLTTLQSDIQQTLPALASLTSGFSITNSAVTSQSLTGALSAVTAVTAAQPPPANFGQNLSGNFSTRSSGNFGQNVSTPVGGSPPPTTPNTTPGFVLPTPTGLTNAAGQPPGARVGTNEFANAANAQAFGLLVSLQNDLQHAALLISALNAGAGSTGVVSPGFTNQSPSVPFAVPPFTNAPPGR